MTRAAHQAPTVRAPHRRRSRHRRGGPRAPRGVALMMVLSVVAAASILSWAMLASASLRAQADVNAADALDASLLAESGVSYALYYLRYPAKSPVTLTAGSFGDRHYGGEAGVRLWADARGTVDIAVANTAKQTFTVRASAVVDGTRRTVEADARLVTRGYPVVSGAGFNNVSAFALPGAMTINGPVVTRSTITNAGSRVSGSPPITPTGSNVVPAPAEAELLNGLSVPFVGTGALATDRTYTFDGQTYAAERLPSTVAGTLVSARPTLNPKNVWYADAAAVSFTNVSLNGTLLLSANTVLSVSGPSNSFTNQSGMPAVVAGKQIDLVQTVLSAGRLSVRGVAWVGGSITGSGFARNDGSLTVQGALLMGGTAPTIALRGSSPTNVTYLASSVANVDNLSTVRTIEGVNVLAYRTAE